jgi:hypothetical protein
MDDFIIQGTEPIIKVDSLGIGINTIGDIQRLTLDNNEYLVVGDGLGTADYNSNQYDTKWNMYVNHQGVAINTSRNINSNYRDPNASLYINRNIQCDGMISAHGIQFSNISIKGEIGSNTVTDLIQSINVLSQSQPFKTGIVTYFNNLYDVKYPVNNIYTPNYLTLGGLVDTAYNQHPLNINSTPNNDFNNIHLALRNDTYNTTTKELSKLSIGIIGGSNISPAVIATTKGMPLEFHVNKSSAEINSLYNRNAVPSYLNDTQYAAMTIDNNGNVCIGKNLADYMTYYKNVLNNGVSSNITINKQTRFDVRGTAKFDDIIIFDNFTNDYKHMDAVYIRADGVGIIRPSQISAGIFYGCNYTFNNISVNNGINSKYITVSDRLDVGGANVENIVINNSAVFKGDTSFLNTTTLSMNRLNVENDLFIGGIRVNPINISDETLGYTTITSNTDNGNKYFFTYVHSNIANLDANRNISFPNKLSVGPNTSEGFTGVVNIFKTKSSNNNFEVIMQEKVNADNYIANIGRLSYLDFYDNSLLINTNNIEGKKHNIYFYPSYDITKLQNNVFLPNLINTPPMLAITNNGVGINVKTPHQGIHLDVNGKLSATDYYVYKDDVITKMAGFVHNPYKNYFNIYNENTYKYCINYDNITAYASKMQGLNVKQGINSDKYYQNDKLIETLQVTNVPDAFYTNKKIALGWGGEDVHLPLQIRNTNIEDYNNSVIRIYRGVRGGGVHNNADYSGLDICEYDRDLGEDRDLERWFIYKNHKFNDIDSRDVKRIGPLQIGYTDKTIEPTTFGMSMYYNNLNSNYHIEINNPNVTYDFLKEGTNTAVSIYGDLDVYGNVNIIDSGSNNFNYRLKKLEGLTELSKYIDVVSASNIIYKNIIDHDDIEYSGKNIIFKPIKSIIVDSIVNDAIPFVVKQNNQNYSAAKFITYSSNISRYSSLELGIYNNNNFTTGFDDYHENINNMIEFRVANKNTSNTSLTFSYYKNDNNNDFYNPFVEFNNSFSKTYMHLGQSHSGYNSNISLHIDDDNKCGLQITNLDNPIKINLVNITGDHNKFKVLSSGDDNNNHKFTIDVAITDLDIKEPRPSDIVNIFTIDPYTNTNNLRDGVRYGFNEPNPIQTMSINSEYDEQTMLINARYTKDFIYTIGAINSSNLALTPLTLPVNTNNWDNTTKIYDTKFNYNISNVSVPSYDIYGNKLDIYNRVVYKTLSTVKQISYLSIHSNINLTFKFNESNANIINSNYTTTFTNNTTVNTVPRFRVNFNSENINSGDGKYLFNMSAELKEPNNKIINLNEIQYVNNATSNIFDITLNNNIISRNYYFSCIFNNIYNIPSYLTGITTSNTVFTSNYSFVRNTNTSSNIISLTNEIYTYLPQVSTNWNVSKLFVNKNTIKLDDINSISNLYINATTSNFVRYNNDAYTYQGKFAIFRTNYLNINSSNIVPNTLSNSNYIINYNSNIIYYNNGTSYNNISNIINIRTSNEFIDDRYKNELIHVSSNLYINDVFEEFAKYGAGLSNTIIIDQYYRKYVNNCNINIQLTNYNRDKIKPHIILASAIRDDYIDRTSLINEIYSYDGNLKFSYSDNQFEHPQLLIDRLGNIQFYGNVSTSNDLFISGNIFDIKGKNVIEDLDRKISSLETNNSNLLLSSVDTIITNIDYNELSMSNYVLSTNNTLVAKANLNDRNSSNYVLSTSNILVTKANFNDRNSSNYVLSTSNILVTKANFNDRNSSNYVLSTSNILVEKANFNDNNMSNYVLSTSNILVAKANFNDRNSSNYVFSTSNILIEKANLNESIMSNYVLSTSNIISRRITNLTTDMITENNVAANKFIVNNVYNNTLLVRGDLTVSSNLIVLGASTTLETEVYTTERLEINNANNTTVALNIKQNDLLNDIIRASNRNGNVYTLGNNGDIKITGTYFKNNRDIILDTSNYVLSASNINSKKIDDEVSGLNNIMRINDVNNSNYVLLSSNRLASTINNIRNAWFFGENSVYTLNNISIGTTCNIDRLTVDGGIIASGGVISSFSDNRLKNHTSNIANPIDLINKLNGFHYIPNELALRYGFTKTPDIGLSAQEVQSILPEIVKIAPFDMMCDDYNNIVSKSGDNYLTICYEKLAPLFVESIKALKKEINELRLEVAELRSGRN